MRLIRFLTVIMSVFASAAVFSSPAASQRTQGSPPAHFARRAIVGAVQGGQAAADQTIRDGGGRIVSYHAPGNYYLVETSGDAPSWVELMRGRSGIRYAELDYRVQADVLPNDPQWLQMWGLEKVRMPSAWDSGTGSDSVVVGVIDSGVDYSHEDITPGQMWKNPTETIDGVDNDGNSLIDDIYGADCVNNDGDPMDDHSHGTHVAGTIGAATNNSTGVAGMNWNVQIMALKFLDSSGYGYTSDAIECLDYAIAKGAQLTNNSWGGGRYSTAVFDAIERARSANQLFVAAAGNDGKSNDSKEHYPSSYTNDNVIAVAATDSSDSLASFSNYGPVSVDIAAPGVSIRSTTLNNNYTNYNGTSMATPHVAGAAALLLSRTAVPPAYGYLRDLLYQNAESVAGLQGKVATGGRLDVFAAAQALGAPPPAVPTTITASPSGATVAESSTLRSGNASNLSSNDNLYYEVNSTVSGTRLTSWFGTFSGVPASLSNLKVTYQGKNSRTCTQTVSIWNNVANLWEQLNVTSVSTTEVLIADRIPANAASQYVNAAGEVKVRVRCTRKSATFYSSGDLMKIAYETP